MGGGSGGPPTTTEDLTSVEDIAASTLSAKSIEGFGGLEVSIQELGPVPYVDVADEAFPMKPYLLRPYPGRHLQEDSASENDESSEDNEETELQTKNRELDQTQQNNNTDETSLNQSHEVEEDLYLGPSEPKHALSQDRNPTSQTGIPEQSDQGFEEPVPTAVLVVQLD
eukprot:superscaffoldBa00006722_g21834